MGIGLIRLKNTITKFHEGKKCEVCGQPLTDHPACSRCGCVLHEDNKAKSWWYCKHCENKIRESDKAIIIKK